MKNIYIVQIQKWEYDSDSEDIFATFDKQKAYDYVDKFKRLQESYEDFTISDDDKLRNQIINFTRISHIWVSTIEVR